MVGPGSRRDAAGGYGADVLGFTESAFALLRNLIAERVGAFYSDDKRDQLGAKLSDLMAARGMTSYLDYYYLLRYDADADQHWSDLADRLAVPETFFWRQADQLLALSQIIAPRHFERFPNRPLRIWSAACCSGEEPLSIAIALAEAGLLDTRRIEIVGSDASPAMIQRARRGVYGERAFRALPALLRDKYFRQVGFGWLVDPHMHGQVRWAVANLVVPTEVRPLAAADVIFCRNVFLYFADETIARVARLFAEGLAADGHLFLGAAESLTRMDTEFELDEVGGAFVYVKGSSRSKAHDRRFSSGPPPQSSGR